MGEVIGKARQKAVLDKRYNNLNTYEGLENREVEGRYVVADGVLGMFSVPDRDKGQVIMDSGQQ